MMTSLKVHIYIYTYIYSFIIIIIIMHRASHIVLTPMLNGRPSDAKKRKPEYILTPEIVCAFIYGGCVESVTELWYELCVCVCEYTVCVSN